MLIILIYLTLACDQIDRTYGSLDTKEQELLKDLFWNYSTDSRPAANAWTAVEVEVKMLIVRLDTVSEKGQSMRTKLHARYEWTNPTLTWKPSDYNEVTEVIIKKSKIWTPPIMLLNEASRIHGEILEPEYEDTVVLTHNGSCSLSFSHFYKSTCEIDVSKFPFDTQECMLRFGSWSMDSSLLSLTNVNTDAEDINYSKNGEWGLKSATLSSKDERYSIQKKDHSLIILTLNIERKYFFFIMNLVVPCALIACMIFLVFVLPPKSGERISLGITVMLSMAIFQELSSEKLPSSSDNYPLLGIYYSTSMFEIGIALVMNCFILNLYYRNYDMPPWVRRLVLGKLSKLVFVPVPEHRTQEYIEANNNEILREMMPMNDNQMNGSRKDSTIHQNGNSDYGYPKKKMSMVHDESPITRSRPSLLMRGNTLREIREEGMDRNMSVQSTMPMLLDDTNREEKKQLGEDWRIAARIMDRIMLTISISVGVLSALSIFLQAERFRNMFTGD